jgi:hypothetical protein
MQGNTLVTFSEAGQKKIQERIENLRIDLGASGAILSSESGQLLVECGHIRNLDIDAFLALLGNAMSATNAVVHLLHDEASFDLHFHEGQNYEMYTTRLNDQVFLTLILERGLVGTSRIGMVWLTLRRAVTELRALIKKSLLEPSAAESAQIKSTVSDVLDEAMNVFESNIIKMPPAPPVEETPPAPRPRRKLPGREKPPAAPPPSDSTQEQPTPPKVSPDILNDPNHPLTYEEARALGLIDLDNLKAD